MAVDTLSSLGDFVDDDLQLDYEEACNEVVELQAELRAATIEARQLQMNLQAATRQRGAQTASGGPAALPAAGAAVAEEQRTQELRGFLAWLAEHADLEHQDVLDVGFAVPIGGRTVQLLRVVQWGLASAPGGRLRISAPVEHQANLNRVLSEARAGAKADAQALRDFVAAWDLIPGELNVAAEGETEPSVLLAHRCSTQGILVATWPSKESLEAFHALRAAGGEAPRVGDRVEVDFQGKWYSGTLHSVDATGKASVKCDVDAPGVFTVTPLCCLRRLTAEQVALAGDDALAEQLEASAAPSSPAKRQMARHRRTRSSAL